MSKSKYCLVMCKKMEEKNKPHNAAQRKELKETIKRLKTERKTCKGKECRNIERNIALDTKILNESSDKYHIKECAQKFCNVGCKNTIYEDGPANKLPEPLKKRYDNDAKHIGKYMANAWQGAKARNMLKTRKKLFGNKISILKDNFYIGLPKKTVKKLKQRGAISGCWEDLFKQFK